MFLLHTHTHTHMHQRRALVQKHARTLTHTQFELDTPVGINTSFERGERQFQHRPEKSDG